MKTVLFQFGCGLGIATLVMGVMAGLYLLNTFQAQRETSPRPPQQGSVPTRQSSSPTPTAASRPQYVPGEAIVKFRQSISVIYGAHVNQATTSQSINQLLTQIQATEIKSFNEEFPPLFSHTPSSGSSGRPGFDRFYIIRFDPNTDVIQVVAQLKADPAVEEASPNHYSYAQ